MRANDKKFLHFLEGNDKNFVIPVYQRNYDWKKEHCERLFDDLIDMIKHNFRTHFIGSIVSLYHDASNTREYLIIDGQQRITTMSLLLLAMYNLVERKVKKFDPSPEKLKEEYLINKYSPSEKKVRLKPIKNDQKAFMALFSNDKDNFIDDSNISHNYRYFEERLTETSYSFEDIFKAIEQLSIVEIELRTPEDDPQLIFESLNSTGLELTQADLIRNFILMSQPSNVQEKFYEEYWHPIEKNTNYKVDEFIRNYLTLKENVIPKQKYVYDSFKRFVKNLPENLNIENVLKDILYFSKLYRKIIFTNTGHAGLDEIMGYINRLEMSVSYPFLLDVLDSLEKGILKRSEVQKVFKILESYSLRRIICDIPTHGLNKFFMTLSRDIKKESDYQKNYLPILFSILKNKKLSQRFPTDKEFSLHLITRDIYNMNSKNKLHLLERLENNNNKEKVSLHELVSSKEITIEHIMPQRLNKVWKDELGKNFNQIHEEYLHTIGNLSLTGYNSELKNKAFSEKKQSFENSRLMLNKLICKFNNWTENSIRKRAKELLYTALQVWEYPETNFVLSSHTDNQYTLDESGDFTHEKVKSFSFDNQVEAVNSWREFLHKVALKLYDFDPEIFKRFIDDPDFKGRSRKQVSCKRSDMRTPLEISKNLFIEGNLSSSAILEVIKLLLSKYQLDPEEITFSLVKD
jgi:uncharacterized protein with ParB-like and HNH nuclease domain